MPYHFAVGRHSYPSISTSDIYHLLKHTKTGLSEYDMFADNKELKQSEFLCTIHIEFKWILVGFDNIVVYFSSEKVYHNISAFLIFIKKTSTYICTYYLQILIKINIYTLYILL
jgi:hypothetical protein